MHGIGVLARSRKIRSGSPQLERYLLRAVSRVAIAEDRISSDGPIATIAPEIFPDRPEDARAAPKEFLDAITELSEEWDAGDHWRSAFQLMVRSPLAQWATSLATL